MSRLLVSMGVLLPLICVSLLFLLSVPTSASSLEEEEAPAAPFTAEEATAEQAFDGYQPQTSYGNRRLKSRLAAEQQQQVDSFSSSFSELSSSFAPPTGPHVKQASKRGNAPLPVSQFGVPSVADEECAMCLYFIQRIQNGVADRLDNPPGAPPKLAGPGETGAAGLPGATAAAQQALKVRNTNSRLQKKPGGRGIVRVVTEDLTSSLCAVDRMPLLFTPYCSAFNEPNTINAVRKGIFFNIPTVEVCTQAALCRDDSYINTNAAVHSSKTSMFLNGQRGICGMLGGSRDKPTSREGKLINAICQAHGAVFGQDKEQQ